jgi:uncharacterized membrane protein YbhN (UPF0104 family)
MKAGLGAQTVYLKVTHAVPYARFAACFAANYLTHFMAMSVVGLGLSLGFYLGGKSSGLMAGAFAVLAGICAAIVTLPARWSYAGKNWFLRKVASAVRAWDMLRTAPGLLTCVGTLRLLAVLLRGLRLYVCLRLLGYEVPFAGALLMSLITAPIHMIGIVPGSLGVREAGIAFMGTLIGLSVEVGALGAALDRAANMLVIIPWGTAATALLRRKPLDSFNNTVASESQTKDVK